MGGGERVDRKKREAKEDKCCSQMEKQKRMIRDRRGHLTPGNHHGGNIAGCAGVIR